MSRVNFTEASEGYVNRDDVPAEGLSLANCANSSGVRFTLFKNPPNFLSYGSLVAGLLIAANTAIRFLDSAQNPCGLGGIRFP